MTNAIEIIHRPIAASSGGLLAAATDLLAAALGDDGPQRLLAGIDALYAALPVERHDPLVRAVCRAATIHGVAPLVHWRLERAGCLHELPSALGAFLAQQRERNGAKMALMLDELRAILAAANEAGIDLLPLKGATLVMGYYPAPDLRPMADLDLLVRPADEGRALALLQRLGYGERDRTERHRVLALPRNSGPVVDTSGEHPDNPRSLELHTRLEERFWGISYHLGDGVWERGVAASWRGVPVRQTPPLPLIEHLLIHATTDIMAGKLRLVRLYDLHLVAAQLTPDDWTALVASALGRGEGRMLYGPLLLQDRLFGGVPAAVLAALGQQTPPPLRRYLARSNAYSLSFCNQTPSSLGDKLCWYRPGREQLRALRAMVVPRGEDLRARFPRLMGTNIPPLAATTLACCCYALLAASWPLRRLLRLRRHGAR